MVRVFPAQLAVTPAGNPEAAPMPLAPVVVWVTLVIVVFIQTDGLDDAAEVVFVAVTVIVPVAFTFPQPPVSGMV